MASAMSIERVASSGFVLGADPATQSSTRPRSSASDPLSSNAAPYLSRQVTIGRNSQFHNLSAEGREKLGGCYWGFYSAKTMVNNPGFTLTSDAMIAYQDAAFPLLIMTFLAYAGNTGLPYALDRAVVLPSDVLGDKLDGQGDALASDWPNVKKDDGNWKLQRF
ncbi:hypothetical protein B0J12DRAFT_790870 [Macrophomina phaseolina]|uniref:Uncharacterized protein n=1 Tax=Macrophomina phaseolina TaxID=35725 RepID=A0ABQ8FQK3_9PEZI|nr:hypothetical protein B0J12DRAFT_790870 [Macrophomina phaseolina]